MKKYLLTALLAVVGCLAVMAGDDIKLTEGSVASLKDGGVASLVIDMADAKYDNKMPLREDGRFANVDEQLPECSSEFIREFNKNSKNFLMTADESEAQYQFVVTITNLDTYVMSCLSRVASVSNSGVLCQSRKNRQVRLLLSSQSMRRTTADLITRLLLKRDSRE